MSQENVEIVRDFFQALNKWLDSYWSDPARSLGGPRINEVFDRMDPDAEWDWVFSPDTFRGRDRILQALADWLETVSDWHIEVDEVIDGTENRVLVRHRVLARGKGSGAPIEQRLFVAVIVRNGKVARIEDHIEEAEALEAVGLSEQDAHADS
jgi:ketosteroid isomerase-like protein